MSTLWSADVETGDLSQFDGNNFGTPTADNTRSHGGSWSLKCLAGASKKALTGLAQNHLWVDFYWFFASTPSGGDALVCTFLSTGADLGHLVMTGSGKLAFSSHGSQLGSTGSTTVSTSAWHHILIEFINNQAAGTGQVVVTLDGSTEISGGSASADGTQIDSIAFGPWDGNGQTFWYDDLSAADTAPPSTTTIAPATGSLALSGTTVEYSLNLTTIAPSSGALTLTGTTAGYSIGLAIVITPDPATLTLTGNAIVATVKEFIAPSTAALAITGQQVGAGVLTWLAPSTGALTLAGQPAGIVRVTAIAPSCGSLAVTGQSPRVFTPPTLTVQFDVLSRTRVRPQLLVDFEVVARVQRTRPRLLVSFDVVAHAPSLRVTYDVVGRAMREAAHSGRHRPTATAVKSTVG